MTHGKVRYYGNISINGVFLALFGSFGGRIQELVV